MTAEEAIEQIRRSVPYLGSRYTVDNAGRAMTNFIAIVNKEPKKLTVSDLTSIARFIDQWKDYKS